MHHSISLIFICLFVAANAVLLIVLPPRISITKIMLILAGIAALYACWLFVYFKLPRPFPQHIPIATWKEFNMRNTLSVIVLLLVNFFGNVVCPAMVRTLARWHAQFNKRNLHKKPMQIFMNNTDKLEWVYRLLFFVGTIPAFYGVWTDPNVIK